MPDQTTFCLFLRECNDPKGQLLSRLRPFLGSHGINKIQVTPGTLLPERCSGYRLGDTEAAPHRLTETPFNDPQRPNNDQSSVRDDHRRSTVKVKCELMQKWNVQRVWVRRRHSHQVSWRVALSVLHTGIRNGRFTGERSCGCN